MASSALRNKSAPLCLFRRHTGIASLRRTGQAQTAPAKAQDEALTLFGVTLYGTVDIGVAHLDHGAPLSATYAPGLPFLLQKFNNKPITSIAPNGLSQSRIGVSAVEPIGGGVSAVFKLETGFLPTSGQLADGPKSVVLSNGVPLDQQRESGDSSRAGQPFPERGLRRPAIEDLRLPTYGRQTSLILDNLQKYDPQQQSQAFSPIGYSGVAGGGGDTEDARLDQAIKYAVQYRFARLTVLHQFERANGRRGSSTSAATPAALRSTRPTPPHQRRGVGGLLTTAQAAAALGPWPDHLDNTVWTLQGKYAWKGVKLFAGYEHIELANPPIAPALDTIGGYRRRASVSNAAYTHQDPAFAWSARRAWTPKLTERRQGLRNSQNSYKGNGCTDCSASSCAGAHNEASLVAAYKLTRHFDLYAGVNYSSAYGGMASGYLSTEVFSQTGGVRFSF